MGWTIKLLDPDTQETLELDIPHSAGSIYALAVHYKCIVEVDSDDAMLDFTRLSDMSAFESAWILKSILDSEVKPGSDLERACAALVEWANLYPHGVWLVT